MEQIQLREINMLLRSPFETSFGTVRDRRILLVETRCDGATGWGECTAMGGPFFNSETIDTTWVILRDYLIPILLAKEINGVRDIPKLWQAVRGHEMAAGYQRIKLKIKPGKDIDVVREVRRQLPQIKLSVDANSAYTLADAQHLKRLDEFELLMMEQPLEWDDIYYHARLQEQLTTAICLDESIRHLRDASAAVEGGSCRAINIKLGRVGGHTEASRMQAWCADRGVPVWCGGMMESGIGRAHNIAMSSQHGFIWPGDVSASQRYWEEDIIEPEVEVTSEGSIRVPTSPGLGYRVRERRIQQLTVRQESYCSQAETVLAT